MSTTERVILPVVNLKGGTTKTTSAVFLAHALHEMGRTVLLVDADPQASATGWNEDAPTPFPFRMVQLATKLLHRQLPDVAGDRFDAVVIDTPPLEEKAGIVVSALRVATMVVCPVAPTPIEYKRLAAVDQAVKNMAEVRADEQAPPLAVLLTRTVPNALSTSAWREQIVADGLWCLRASVGRLERYSQAESENVTDASRSAYGDAVRELLAKGSAA